MRGTIPYFLFLTLFFFSFTALKAQPAPEGMRPNPPVQVELSAGYEKTLFQSIIIKPLDKKHRFDFFNISYFDNYYDEENKPFNEGLIQTYVAYNFIKGVGVGLGGTYNSFGGVSANLVGQFVNAGPNHLIVFFATIYLEENPQYEAFTQLQYRFRLNDDWRLFTQLMALTNWVELEDHNRSFQQLRVGLDYRNYQFGIGADFDQYTPLPEHKGQVGLFVRAEIFN